MRVSRFPAVARGKSDKNVRGASCPAGASHVSAGVRFGARLGARPVPAGGAQVPAHCPPVWPSVGPLLARSLDFL